MHLSFSAYFRSPIRLDYCREKGAPPPACLVFHVSRHFQVPIITNDNCPLFILQVPIPRREQDNVSLVAEVSPFFSDRSASCQPHDPASVTDVSYLHHHIARPLVILVCLARATPFLTWSRSITGSMTSSSATLSFPSLIYGMSYSLTPHSSTHLLELGASAQQS